MFFVWDASWYDDIARRGYQYDKSQAGFQNAAFWPLWPGLLRLLHGVFGAAIAFRAAILVLTSGLTLGAAIMFHKLAVAVVNHGAARRATMLYCLSPAMPFLLRSYPAAALNLAVFSVLLLILRRRFLAAALGSALATATAPAAISLPPVLVLCKAVESRRVIFGQAPSGPGQRARAIVGVVATGLIAASGLVVFMLILWRSTGDPFAFVAAEKAWGAQQDFWCRLVAWGKMQAIVPDILAAFRHAGAMLRAPSAAALNGIVQWHVNAAVFAVALAGLYAGARSVAWPLLLQGWLVLAIYAWFIGSVQGYEATIRLVAPAPACFIGVALCLQGSKIAFAVALGISVVSLVAESMAGAAGYWVV